MEMLGEPVLSRAPLDAVRDGSSWGLMPACFAELQKAVSPHLASIPIELSEQELPPLCSPGGTKHRPCFRQHLPVPPSSILASWRWHLGVWGAGDHGWVPGWVWLGQGQSSDLHDTGASITQCLLSSPGMGRAQSPRSSAVLPGFSRQQAQAEARLGLGPSLLEKGGWGISRRKQIPTVIKKGHFLQERLCWRGERALCCNRGEGRRWDRL